MEGVLERECVVCREMRDGLPARTSCLSASLPGWACAGGPHLPPVPRTHAWPSCSSPWLLGLVSSQHWGDQCFHKLSVESGPGPQSSLQERSEGPGSQEGRGKGSQKV